MLSVLPVCRYLDIPKQLSRRINVYFEFLTQYSHPGTDGTTLINQLPSSMAQDINSWCYRSMLVKVSAVQSKAKRNSHACVCSVRRMH